MRRRVDEAPARPVDAAESSQAPQTPETQAAPSAPAPASSRRRRLSQGLLAVAATLVLCAVPLTLILHLGRATLDVPFEYSGDVNFYASVVKGTIDHGWYLKNPDLGAPFGLDFHDFPLSDNNLQLLLVKGVALFSTDPAVVVNVLYLLSYPLVALVALFVLRRLGVSSAVAVAGAVLFAFAPYHFTRGENHLFFSLYVAVPLGAYLALLAFHGGRPPGGITGLSRIGLIALAVVVGSASAYYAVFTVVLIAAATAVGFLVHRTWHQLLFGGAALAVIGGTLFVNVLPTVLYRSHHGANDQVANRSPFDTELYSLKLSALLLPVSGHRLEAASALRERYDKFPLRSEDHALGTLGTIGFLWLGGITLATLAGLPRRERLARYGPAAALVLVAVAFATIGGLSSVVALLITTQFRAWNRMTIFIAFLALAAVAWLLDDVRELLRRRRVPTVVLVGGLAAVLVFGLWDQSTRRAVPDYAGVAATYRSDGDYVRQIESRLPKGAIVHQLPYEAFPEPGPVHDLLDYDHSRLYLHSRTLRWTYGGMRGRPEDWPAELADEPVSVAAPALVASGVSGISVDRNGYADRGRAVEAELTRITGAEPLVSANGRLAFFDLSAYRHVLEANVSPDRLASAREATLQPVRPVWGTGFAQPEQDSENAWRWALPVAEVDLVNPTAHDRRVVVTFDLEAQAEGSWNASVVTEDGATAVPFHAKGSTRFTQEMTFRPGHNRVRFVTDAPKVSSSDFLPRAFRVLNFSLTDTAVLDVARVDLAGS